MEENNIMNNEELNNEAAVEAAAPVEVTEPVAQPSTVGMIAKSGLILGGTALVGSVVLKVGDAIITKTWNAAKAGVKKLADKVKTKNAERKAKKEETE